MGAPLQKNKNVWILAFTLIAVMLGYGIIIPILPFYIESMGAGGTELGLLVAAYAMMRLLFGPIWGSASDRFGRKPILMVGVFGYAVAMFFFGLATQLWMIFAARILSGILSSATAPTTMAYIADSTSEEDRGGGMGILGAAVGIGTILGPGLGGLLSGGNIATPFFIAAGLSLVAVGFIYWFLPESHPKEQRVARESKLNRLSLEQFRCLMTSPIAILLILTFIATCGLLIFYGIFGLYALDKFGYGPVQVGTLMMFLGLLSALGQGILSGPVTKRWGETIIIKATLLLGGIAYLLLAPVQSLLPFLVGLGILMLAMAILIPALTALTSKLAPFEQGIAMGFSNSFMSLGRIVGPLAGGFVFDLNISYPFLAGAGVLFLGFFLSLAGIRGIPVSYKQGALQIPRE